ncbi:MAG TPA: hypothetical protein VGR22_08200 [Thermomicrobiales bacterium]|nr:hypothetical protein [Thermomicrobiales bacterium]
MTETVASGLSVPLSRPWLLVLPILLDVLLLVGMQIPITRLITPLADEMEAIGGENGDLAAEQFREVGETFWLNDVMGSLLPSVFAGLSHDNLFNVMMAVFTPGLADGVDRGDLADTWLAATGAVRDPGSIWSILGLGLLFFLVSTLLTVGWRVPLALLVAGRTMRPIEVARYVARSWLRFLGLIGLMIVGAMVVIAPVMIGAGVLLLMQVNLAALISLFLVLLGSLIAIYTRFVLESIVVNDIGPLRALRRSARLAHHFFGPTVRFSIAVMLIAVGALRLWDTMASSVPGLPIAILVNSFLGTGIAIATMMFYYDRDRIIRKFETAPGSK